jgi:HemY protein
LIILFTVLVYAALRLVYRLVGGRDSVASWLGTRKAHHAARLTTRGLISFVEGNWDRARRQLLRGAKHNDNPLFNYLMAARASYRLDDGEGVSEYLGSAEDNEAGAAAAVALTRAEMQLHAGQFERVLESLEPLGRNRYPQALELHYRACYGLRDWEGLGALLPELKKHKVLDAEPLGRLQREVHMGLLRGSIAAGDSPAEGLRTAWQRVPADLKHDSQLLNCYVGLLLECNEDAAAEKIILRALKRQWDSGLVRQFGLLEGDSPARQLQEAEAWLPAHPEDPELLLCLGRLSARDKLWGKARDYFESCYRLRRTGEVCAELGRLLAGLGEPRVAAAYYREGLSISEGKLPELPMPQKQLPHRQMVARS